MKKDNATITVACTVKSPVKKVWEFWTSPHHIVKWNQASDDWHTTRAENDLRTGGKFSSRMEAKDGSMGFDFEGIYERVIPEKQIEYKLADGRKVSVSFNAKGNETLVVESFEAENVHPEDFQQKGWQAILDNFKNYAEKEISK